MASCSEFSLEAKTTGLCYQLNRKFQDDAKVSRDEMERNKKTVCDIVDKVIEHMQKDATFQASYVRNIGVGSSHEKLKVREADEFDYNICLKIPDGWKGQIEGPSSLGPQGYAMYKLDVGFSSSTSLVHRKWQSFMDHSHYLLPFKLYDWFYGLVAKALASSELKYCDEMQGVTLRRAEPSANLIINKPGRQEMSVDLAPTLQMVGNPPGFRFPDTWPNKEMTEKIEDVMRCNSLWQICTKEYTGAVLAGNERWWRISTSPLEKYVLNTIDRYNGVDSRGGSRKTVLRLLKLLREMDGSNWLAIKSYHLKHLVMLESCRYNDWPVEKIDVRFIGCLRALENSLRKRNLQNVFFPEMNLFHDLKFDAANNLAYRVKKIADKIEKDPELINKYLTCSVAAENLESQLTALKVQK
ncbi:cyclic GMP-AMP synthase-like receptor 3 [Saccoglossus kowalevskii]